MVYFTISMISAINPVLLLSDLDFSSYSNKNWIIFKSRKNSAWL